MSMLAKGVTIGVLATAGLAAPIIAMVTYLQTKPANTALIQFTDPYQPPPEPLAATIVEPELVPEAPVSLRPSPVRREVPRQFTGNSQAPPREPHEFVLELPRVERSALLDPHYSTSPGGRSTQMPPPIQRAPRQSLQYEEQFR